MLEINNKNDSFNKMKSIFDSFFTNMDHVMQFTQDVIPFTSSLDEKASKKHSELKSKIQTILNNRLPSNIEDNPIVKDKPDEQPRIEIISDSVINLLNNLRLTPFLNSERTEILNKSSLIIILSYFDYTISDIIRCHLILHPNDLPEDSNITLHELYNFRDKEEAINYIINKKVNTIVSEGLKYITNYFSKHLKIDTGNRLINWDLINEANEKRNCIVHNNGIVDNDYLRKTKYINIPTEFILNIGDPIKINNEYFNNVYYEILFAGILLLQNCWHKWYIKDTKEADFRLITIYDVIIARNINNFAMRLYSFSKGLNMNDYNNEQFDLGYCICLKRLGRFSDLDTLISKLTRPYSSRTNISLLQN
jgi:hypothetical protein